MVPSAEICYLKVLLHICNGKLSYLHFIKDGDIADNTDEYYLNVFLNLNAIWNYQSRIWDIESQLNLHCHFCQITWKKEILHGWIFISKNLQIFKKITRIKQKVDNEYNILYYIIYNKYAIYAKWYTIDISIRIANCTWYYQPWFPEKLKIYLYFIK